MMVQDKIDTFHFEVSPFDDDYTGRLSWNVLGKDILACAEKHAGAREFNHLTLHGHRLLWVLSRMVFEITSWPKLGEKYTISTWIRNYYRYFTERCFEIQNAQGEIIGRVFTIWAMIDEITRKPQMLEELFGQTFNRYIDTERPFEVQPFSRIRLKEEDLIYSRKSYYSDIDENNHVNSIRYIEFIADAFPKELFSTHQISRLEIAYNSESYYNEELLFYREQAGQDQYNIIIKKQDKQAQTSTETICHCAIKFDQLKKAP